MEYGIADAWMMTTEEEGGYLEWGNWFRKMNGERISYLILKAGAFIKILFKLLQRNCQFCKPDDNVNEESTWKLTSSNPIVECNHEVCGISKGHNVMGGERILK